MLMQNGQEVCRLPVNSVVSFILHVFSLDKKLCSPLDGCQKVMLNCYRPSSHPGGLGGGGVAILLGSPCTCDGGITG